MPEKEKLYPHVIFSPEVIREAVYTLKNALPKENEETVPKQEFMVKTSSTETWRHDNEEEFFADYRKGFVLACFRAIFDYAKGRIEIFVFEGKKTQVTVSMSSRANVEKVFNVFEANVEKCRLPKQPQTKSKIETNWITETINKVEERCPTAGRKIKLALIKLESEESEDWQNATMLIRDAWIELTQWLCQVKIIDTSDILPDAVVERLRKLEVDTTDERLFNLARASFNLYSKHHKRNIEHDAAIACVISTIVSMQSVIREVT